MKNTLHDEIMAALKCYEEMRLSGGQVAHIFPYAQLLRRAEKELRECQAFVHDATLEIQQHRSRTPEQMDYLFQRAYRLYVSLECEAAALSREKRK